jgi:hypothetical protein
MLISKADYKGTIGKTIQGLVAKDTVASDKLGYSVGNPYLYSHP